MSSSSSTSKTTTDHEEIRKWAEARGGKPSCVLGTGGGGDTGLLRIDFPGYSGEGSLKEISWEEFFDKFDTEADQIDRDYDEYELETEEAGPSYQLVMRWAF